MSDLYFDLKPIDRIPESVKTAWKNHKPVPRLTQAQAVEKIRDVFRNRAVAEEVIRALTEEDNEG